MLGFIAATVFYLSLRAENARRAHGERDEVIRDAGDGNVRTPDPKNGTYDSVDEARRDKGDQWSGYRYTL